MLTERVTAGATLLTRLQTDVHREQIRHEAKPGSASSSASSTAQQLGLLPPTTPLSLVMQTQVEELVASRVSASEQLTQSELQKLHLKQREQQPSSTAAASPQAVVDAVTTHLTHFKHEFDANQNRVLGRFTESIITDSVRLDERVRRVEGQLESLESVVQAEQQASLLALEAISDAFAGNVSGDDSREPKSTYSTPTRSGAVGRRR